MYPRDKTQYTPEQLNALQICWLKMKENKIRGRRQAEIIITDSPIINLKRQMELEEKPLSPEEQKEMQDFEAKMIKAVSFGMNLETSDI